MDNDLPKTKTGYSVGQELSSFSVDDLRETIILLKSELIRLEQELADKTQTRSAAENLFKR